MARYRQTASVTQIEPEGTFSFDNGQRIEIVFGKDAVGEITEQMLWPLMKPLLDAGKGFRITIDDLI